MLTCRRILLYGIAVAGVLALPVAYAVKAQQEASAAMLLFEEQEHGTDGYPVRILVTDRHVRIDDGHEYSDFVLLDRASRRLQSVSHEERSILVIDYRPARIEMPADLHLSSDEQVDAEAPLIQGRRPVNRRYLANGEVCLQVVAVPGLLDAALHGLAEYARVLAARQVNNLQTLPEAMRTPCVMARYYFAPAWHLEDGLPIQEWDDAGYRRRLVSFDAEMPAAGTLFAIPAGYTAFTLE